MPARTACVTALVLLVSGCTAGEGAVDGVYPRGRRCQPLTEPHEVPRLRDLTGISIRSTLALWGWRSSPADSVEVAVRYDGTGALAWALPIRSTISRERAERVADLVSRSIPAHAEGEWGYRLLVVGGDIADIRASVVCVGEVRGVRAQHGFTDASDPGTGIRRRSVGELVPVLFEVDATGGIRGVEIQASRRTMGAEIYVLLLAERGPVLPRLHDGVPVASRVREMVRIPGRQW